MKACGMTKMFISHTNTICTVDEPLTFINLEIKKAFLNAVGVFGQENVFIFNGK